MIEGRQSRDVASPDAAFRDITSNLQFPEGPVAMADGSVIVTEIAAGRVTRVLPNGSHIVLAQTGGGPNGLALGPDSYLYCCNNGGFAWHRGENGRLKPCGTPPDWSGGSIQRIDIATGVVTTLYTGAGTVGLRGPNDIVFDSAGGFWFTDFGKTFERSRDRTGIFYAQRDGSHIEEILFPLESPNGVGLSPDGRTLYFAESYTCKLWACEVTEPGRVNRESLRMLYRPTEECSFDSLGVEACGNICVATLGKGGISVVSPAGELVEFVPTDDPYTTNICWGGDDLKQAYVTLSATGRLASRPWVRAGLQLEQGGTVS